MRNPPRLTINFFAWTLGPCNARLLLRSRMSSGSITVGIAMPGHAALKAEIASSAAVWDSSAPTLL